MMRAMVSLAAMAILAACATSLPQIVQREGDLFDVRFDATTQTAAAADAVANAHCANGAAGYISQQVGFEGLTYRTYRCAGR